MTLEDKEGTKFYVVIVDELDDGEWAGPYWGSFHLDLESASAAAKQATMPGFEKGTVKAGIV